MKEQFPSFMLGRAPDPKARRYKQRMELFSESGPVLWFNPEAISEVQLTIFFRVRGPDPIGWEE